MLTTLLLSARAGNIWPLVKMRKPDIANSVQTFTFCETVADLKQ